MRSWKFRASSKQIIEYANSLTGNTEDISRYYYNGELEIYDFKNEVAEAKYVKATIERITNNGHADIEGNMTYERIAVIARSKYLLAIICIYVNRRI